MTVTERKPSAVAAFQTGLIQTDGKCIQIAYASSPGSNIETDLQIWTIPLYSSRDKYEESKLVSSRLVSDRDSKWRIFTARLPNGLNRVVIQAQRPASGISGLLIDEVRIVTCSKLSKSASYYPFHFLLEKPCNHKVSKTRMVVHVVVACLPLVSSLQSE